uniref:Reelin domain-containing protein n=1 Tax=Strigamia maritima TaxID=126957 RepID=T1JAK6_STRMM
MDNSRRSLQFIFLSLLLLSHSAATYEFDEDSCESMIPKEKDSETQNHAHNGDHGDHGDHTHHRRNAEPDEEDDKTRVHRLIPQNSKSPFQVKVEGFEFRRNRPIQVSIVGPEFNGFMLQARAQGKTPIGKFEGIPANAKGLECEAADDTIVHKDTGGKVNVTVTWKAPGDPPVLIVFMLTIIQNEKIWTHIHSDRLPLSPFPPSLTGCGETKSCYRQSTIDNCPPEKCDYLITTQVVKTNEVEMVIGGIVKDENGFIGIGFTMDNTSLTNVDISACIKYKNKTSSEQYFVSEWNNDSISNHDTLDQLANDIDGDMVWCQFRRPLTGLGETNADLSQTLFQTIVTGHINATSRLPLLPFLKDTSFVSEAWNSNHTVQVMHLLSVNSMPKLEVTVVAMFLSIAATYEFDEDSCESMIPKKKDDETQTHAHNGDHGDHTHPRRNAEPDEEDDKTRVHRLIPQKSESPFEVKIKGLEFRRNRLIQVSIVGPEFNGFMLQAKHCKTYCKPIGKFEGIPVNAMGLECEAADDTIVHKDIGRKANVTLTWKAPGDPPLFIIFRQTDDYSEREDLDPHRFGYVTFKSISVPPMGLPSQRIQYVLIILAASLTGCGAIKSCYQQQSNLGNCLLEESDYLITAQIVNANEVEMLIGGIVKEENGFIGIGFATDNTSLTNVDINACIKYNNRTSSEQYFVSEWNNDSISNHDTLDQMASDIDGDMVWCQFRRPLTGLGETNADLSKILFLTIVTGHINATSRLPLLPPSKNISFESEAWNSSNAVHVLNLLSVNPIPVLGIRLVFKFTTIVVSDGKWIHIKAEARINTQRIHSVVLTKQVFPGILHSQTSNSGLPCYGICGQRTVKILNFSRHSLLVYCSNVEVTSGKGKILRHNSKRSTVAPTFFRSDAMRLTLPIVLVIFLCWSTADSKRTKRQFLDCNSPISSDTPTNPRVFLTVSSLVALPDGGRRLVERQLELNWYQAAPHPGDSVGLFAQDPSLSSASPALERVDVAGRTIGYFRTSVTFPRPTFSARALRTDCLGFWVAYVRNNHTLASQCLQNRPSWMWDNRINLGPMRLRELLIPGSHDSGSYQEYQGRASENVITRYTICQDENVWNQLAYGIRYLDFRVGLYSTTRERFWLNHGDFKVNPLQRALTDLGSFLNSTQEIIILDVHRFQWGFDSREQHRELITLIMRELEPHMLPRSAGSEATLADMWAMNKRLLVAYNEPSFLENSLLWPGIPQRWGDKNDAASLNSYLQEVMRLPTAGLWAVMAELTPTTADIIGNPRGSLRVLADKVNRNITLWFRDVWWDKANIVATDFVLGNNMIEVAIEANLRRKLCRDRIGHVSPELPPWARPQPPENPPPSPQFAPHNSIDQQPNWQNFPRIPNKQNVPQQKPWNFPQPGTSRPQLGPWLNPRYPMPIPQPIVSGPPPYKQLEWANRLGIPAPTWYDVGRRQVFPFPQLPFTHLIHWIPIMTTNTIEGHVARKLTEQEAAKLKSDATLVSNFKQNQLEIQAQKNWDLFYKRNSTNFFKDRHWTTREFTELCQENENPSKNTQNLKKYLLEIGCGVGNFIFPLIKEGIEYFIYACDFSNRAVNYVKENSDYDVNKCLAFQMDVTSEKLTTVIEADLIDVVTMIFVLSAIHPDKMISTLKNILQVLKPGGVVLFRDYGQYDQAMLRFKKGHKLDENFYVRQDGTRAYYFTTEFLNEVFTEAGFEQIINDYIQRKTVNKKEGIDVERIFVQGVVIGQFIKR